MLCPSCGGEGIRRGPRVCDRCKGIGLLAVARSLANAPEPLEAAKETGARVDDAHDDGPGITNGIHARPIAHVAADVVSKILDATERAS